MYALFLAVTGAVAVCLVRLVPKKFSNRGIGRLSSCRPRCRTKGWLTLQPETNKPCVLDKIVAHSESQNDSNWLLLMTHQQDAALALVMVVVKAMNTRQLQEALKSSQSS